MKQPKNSPAITAAAAASGSNSKSPKGTSKTQKKNKDKKVGKETNKENGQPNVQATTSAQEPQQVVSGEAAPVIDAVASDANGVEKEESKNAYINVLNKKIRALNKKSIRIQTSEAKRNRGKKLNQEQEELIASKDMVERELNSYRDLHQSFTTIYETVLSFFPCLHILVSYPLHDDDRSLHFHLFV